MDIEEIQSNHAVDFLAENKRQAEQIKELEADLKIKQSVCETIKEELTTINEKLKAENKQLAE